MDKTATVKRRKGYHDAAPEGDDTDVQPSLATVISNVEASGDLATDLENGDAYFYTDDLWLMMISIHVFV